MKSGMLALRPSRHIGTSRFEYRHCALTAANDDLAERTKQRLVTPRRSDRSDADRGAELLVGCLKPSCNVYRVAMSGVVKLGTDSDIANDSGSGFEANAGASKANRRDLGAMTEDLRP